MGTDAADVAGRSEVPALCPHGRAAVLGDEKAAGSGADSRESETDCEVDSRSLPLLLGQRAAYAGESSDAGVWAAAELCLPEPCRIDGAGTRAEAARTRRGADGMDVSAAAPAVLSGYRAGALSPSAGAADYGAGRVSLPLGRAAKDGAAEEDE